MGGLARSRAGALVHTVALALALLVGSGVGSTGVGSKGGRGGGPTIVIGTVQSLSGGGAAGLNTVQFVRAYTFWAEETNARGGVLVNGTRFRVEVRVRDDANNATLRREHLFSLASEGAHALFGGHGNGNDDLSDAAAAHGIPGLTPGNSPDEQFERRPFLFGLSSSPSRYPLEFLTSAYAQGARRVALVTNVGYPITMAVCAAARARAEALGMLVVYEGRYSTADGTPFECQTLVAGMVRARPDTLVGCTLEPDAMGLAHALVNSGVLLGAMPPSSGWTGAVPARVTSRVLRYHQPSRKDQID